MNQFKAESAMPSSAKYGVERRVLWLTVSNAEDKSWRIRTDDLDEALMAPKDSVSVE